jgi:hypothetical protein
MVAEHAIEHAWRDLKRHLLAHQSFTISPISTVPSMPQSMTSTSSADPSCANPNAA